MKFFKKTFNSNVFKIAFTTPVAIVYKYINTQAIHCKGSSTIYRSDYYKKKI